MSYARRVCALALLALAAMTFAAGAEPQYPALTGRVVDSASLLGADDRSALDSQLAALEAKSTDQLVVVTVPSLQGYEIEDYGYQLGKHWGIGQAGKDNGVLLIVAPNERKVRIEVGRKLEPLLTDLMSKLIIENAILPAFRRGDFPGGIRAGVGDIEKVLLGDAEEVKQRAKKDPIGPDYIAWFIVAFWVAVVILIIYLQIRQAMLAPQTIRQRGRGRFRDTTVIIPAGGGSGNWDGGWSGGSGGGWSGGGGGSFGGGGASGSW